MAVLETLTLDGQNLNDGVTYDLESLVMNPPKERPEWVTGGDADGAILGRDPLYENRVIQARVRVVQQADTDTALAKIAAIADRLAEAERTSTGVDLVWTPAGGTKSVTFVVLAGEIEELPITPVGDDAGWFLRTPVVSITLTAKPFGYGSETLAGTTSASTSPLVTLELTNISGDVPAEGRLVVTDAASQSRRHVEWGLESLRYPTSSPPSLIVDSDSLVTSGFAGTGTTRTGAYDPGAAGNSVVRATMATQAVAVCGTGVLSHVGTFRVKARVWPAGTAASIQVRLSWQDGDGPWRANPYVMPHTLGAFCEVDLGTITISPAASGTQRWQGRIEAFSSVIGDTLDVDFLLLVPAGEGYGQGRSAYSYQPGVLVARDEFTSTTAGGALNARVAPSGGTWATSGAATDFTFVDGPDTGGETASRATTLESSTHRYAILGSTNYTDAHTSISFRTNPTGFDRTGGPSNGTYGATARSIARWTDSSNYVYAEVSGGTQLNLGLLVGGSPVILASSPAFYLAAETWYAIDLICFASGTAIAWLATGNTVVTSVTGNDSRIATGGSLQTGKPGFSDQGFSATAFNRHYDAFKAMTPAAEPICVYSGRSMEVRSDSAIRQDSAGTYYGQVPMYMGSRFFVPPAGVRTRKARIAVKARRNDVAVSADDQIADSTTIQAYVRPRYLTVPR